MPNKDLVGTPIFGFTTPSGRSMSVTGSWLWPVMVLWFAAAGLSSVSSRLAGFLRSSKSQTP